jgi:DNA ligase-1
MEPEGKIAKAFLRLSSDNSVVVKRLILKHLFEDLPWFVGFFHQFLSPYNRFGVKVQTTNILPVSGSTWFEDNYEKVWAVFTTTPKHEAALILLTDEKFKPARWILQRLITKDLRCGVGVSLLEPLLGSTFVNPGKGIGLCTANTKTLRYPVLAQPKYDGVRAIARFSETSNQFLGLYSRSHRLISGFQGIQKALAHIRIPMWLDGEILDASGDFFKVAGRAHTTKRSDELAIFVVFDYFYPLSPGQAPSQSPTIDRVKHLQDALYKSGVTIGSTPIRLSPHEVITDEDCLEQYYREKVREGFEGIVAKNNIAYPYRRSSAWVKIKLTQTLECAVVGLVEGKGKYADSLGALIIKHKSVETRVGTGFSDLERKEIWKLRSQVRGGVKVEIAYQSLTPNGAMRFPRFLRFRHDLS